MGKKTSIQFRAIVNRRGKRNFIKNVVGQCQTLERTEWFHASAPQNHNQMVTVSVCFHSRTLVLPWGKVWYPIWTDTIITWPVHIQDTKLPRYKLYNRDQLSKGRSSYQQCTWRHFQAYNQAACSMRREGEEEREEQGEGEGERKEKERKREGTSSSVRKKVLFSLTDICLKSPAARTKTSSELFNITDDKFPNSKTTAQLKGVLL